MKIFSRYINNFNWNYIRKISSQVEKNWLQLFQDEHIEAAHVSIKELKLFVQKSFKNADVNREFGLVCKRRLNREPLQYIIGEWDFRHLNLKMKKPVFIPRPETESLVDLINTDGKEGFLTNPHVLEVGCGSGALLLSLLHENRNMRCVAVDQLKDAVDLTLENADRCGLSDRIKVFHADINELTLEDVGGERFDLLVSNPPYIPSGELQDLQPEVIRYEDVKALDGGKDGLDMVRVLLRQAEHLLYTDSSVWLEVDETHPPKIEKLLKECTNLQYISTYLDCFQRPRFCHLKVKNVAAR